MYNPGPFVVGLRFRATRAAIIVVLVSKQGTEKQHSLPRPSLSTAEGKTYPRCAGLAMATHVAQWERERNPPLHPVSLLYA